MDGRETHRITARRTNPLKLSYRLFNLADHGKHTGCALLAVQLGAVPMPRRKIPFF